MKTTLLFLLIAFWAQAQEQSRYYQNVRVEAGDTLWSLAQHYLKNPKKWPDILKYNTLPSSDPTVALPGRVLKIPVLLIKESLRAAKLIEKNNLVSYRKADSVQWQSAGVGQQMAQQDGLRTGEASRALIRFAAGEDLGLGPNSFAVIKPEALSNALPGGASLMSGEARSRGVRLTAGTATIVPRTQKTDYRARIEQDLSTIVEVYQGAADVSSQGRSVLVNEGFATKVPARAPPQKPVAMPPMPATWTIGQPFLPEIFEQNQPSATLIIQDGKVAFNQTPNPATPPTTIRQSLPQGGKGLASFRIQMAKEAGFEDILWDRSYPIDESFRLVDSRLEDGAYYLRAAYKDLLGFESAFSPGRSIVIDTKPPELKITAPATARETKQSNPLAVRGQSEPGATIILNGKTNVAVMADGKFEHEIVLVAGINIISIAAFDGAGNKTQQSLEINYDTETQLAEVAERIAAKNASFGFKEAAPVQSEQVARTTLAVATVAAILTILIMLLA